MGSSPRWRGRHGAVHHLRQSAGLIPALAGTTAGCSPISWTRWAHPRAGGDDALSRSDKIAEAGSSPRWRGRLSVWQPSRLARGLIPALAGTTASMTMAARRDSAHPRAGGDDTFPDASKVRPQGSSPRWRGRRSTSRPAVSAPGLIPALAGTTQHAAASAGSRRAHPRAGGDDRVACHPSKREWGSSPRWRGRLGCEVVCGCGRVAHPRAGGDDARTKGRASSLSGSSPRWRGRLVGRHPRLPQHGLIPALAGTTR